MNSILAILLLTSQLYLVTNEQVTTNLKSENDGKHELKVEIQRELASETFIEDFMFKYVYGAIKNYYGHGRGLWKLDILSLEKREPAVYRLILSAQTFSGAHDFPYGLETITFDVEFGGSEPVVKVVNYKHKDITPHSTTN